MTTLREHDLRYLGNLAEQLEALSEQEYERQHNGEVGIGQGDDSAAFGFHYAARMVRKTMEAIGETDETD